MLFFKDNFWLKYFSLLIVAVTFIPADGFSQFNSTENTRNWIFSIGPAFSYQSVIDKEFSSNSFRGVTVGGSVDLKHFSANAIHEIESTYTIGNLKLKDDQVYETNQNIFKIGYTNLYSIHRSANERFLFNFGGSLQLLHAGRTFSGFINTNRSFETMLSLGAVIELVYSIPGNFKGLTISNRITFPFVFLYSQSPYLSNTLPGDVKKESTLNYFFKNNEVASMPEVFRLENNFEIEKQLAESHFISLGYEWDYYKIDVRHKILLAGHFISLLYRYKF